MNRGRRRAAGTLGAALVTAGCTSLLGDLFDGYGGDRCTGPGGVNICADASASAAGSGGVSSIHGDADTSFAGRSNDASVNDARAGSGGGGRGNRADAHGPPDGVHGARDARADVGEIPVEGGTHDGPPSCSRVGNICGLNEDDDCCASDVVPGGEFVMGRNASTASVDRPEHSVRISTFRLDRYEVSVGRFRAFVDAYDRWPKPKDGDGASPGHPGSWNAAWTAELPASGDALTALVNCELYGAPAWTDRPAAHEAYAMNCLPWIEAFAFCLWDGGRLPTEAEWEYAAAGGDEQRNYPWGNEWHLEFVNTRNYFRSTRVGEAGGGQGRGLWGQHDLIGNVWEWTSDAYAYYEVGSVDSGVATDPATPFTDALRFVGYLPVLRGGSWWPGDTNDMNSYHRSANDMVTPNTSVGVRCARAPAVSRDDGADADAARNLTISVLAR